MSKFYLDKYDYKITEGRDLNKNKVHSRLMGYEEDINLDEVLIDNLHSSDITDIMLGLVKSDNVISIEGIARKVIYTESYASDDYPGLQAALIYAVNL